MIVIRIITYSLNCKQIKILLSKKKYNTYFVKKYKFQYTF